MFLKHPRVYVEATVGNTYGYFYPFKEYVLTDLTNYTIFGQELFLKKYQLCQPQVFQGIREIIIHIGHMARCIPIYGLFYGTGIYTWIILGLSLLLLCYKKPRELVVLVPMMITILVCFASPVNAYRRYMEPVLLCAPFLVIYVFKVIKDGKDGKSDGEKTVY